MAKILVVEDDKAISEAVVDMLEFEHHVVDAAYDGLDAVERLISGQFDLVILDWQLPDLQGVEILQKFRMRGGKTPVLMLTAKSAISAKLEGFEAGADDYLTKPFDMRELMVRVKALLKRPQEVEEKLVTVRDLTIDAGQFRCTRDGQELKLLPKEFQLFLFLARNAGRVFSADEILNRVWATDKESSEDAVRQCMKRLRDKIDVKGQPSYITTVVGVGYKVELQNQG